MKLIGVWCVVLASVLGIGQAGLGQQGPGARPVRSPEISADRHVTFRLRAPEAKSVELSGEFMKGRVAAFDEGCGWGVEHYGGAGGAGDLCVQLHD